MEPRTESSGSLQPPGRVPPVATATADAPPPGDFARFGRFHIPWRIRFWQYFGCEAVSLTVGVLCWTLGSSRWTTWAALYFFLFGLLLLLVHLKVTWLAPILARRREQAMIARRRAELAAERRAQG